MPRNWYSITSKAESKDSAEISIYDAIGATWDGDGVTAKQFITDLKKIDAKSITLYINSPGGSLFDGVAIHNALRMHGAEITAKVMGVAASAASLIFMAAHKREMPKNSFLMLHNASSMAWGTAAEMRDMAEVLDKIDQSMHATYANRSGKTSDEIKTLLAKDTWMSAEEAVAEGFADTVLDDMEVTAQFDLESLPDNIQAAFKNGKKPVTAAVEPEPKSVEPSATLAEKVTAATEAAGLGQFAAHFALSIETDDALPTALAAAREVMSLCATAGKPDAAADFITSGKPMAEVRAALIDMRAAADEATHTDTAHKSTNPTASASSGGLKPADVWAARRKTH